jgi:gamma-glutamylcyclotransferase (GGCT)/AIG2-like uncharacterized protein YtfP
MLETRLYFAYGANMNMDSMAWRCPGARPIGAFTLKDWELEFYSHANIRENTGRGVPGVLWAITAECEASLDAFEGFPDYYTKRSWMQNDQHIMFYEMAGFKQGQPGQGYIDDIRSSYHYWHLPVEYLDQIVNDTVKKKKAEYI